MPAPELERLAEAGHLVREPAIRSEFEGLLHSGEVRLLDAQRPGF